MADDDAALESLLAAHNTAVLEHVAAMRSAMLSAAAEKSANELSEGVTGEDSDGERASLLKRNMELAAILGLTQKTISEQEVQIKELKLALSRTQHELAEQQRKSAEDPNPYLAGGGDEAYEAASASTVLRDEAMLPLEAATDASDSSDTTAATAVSGSGGGGSVDNEAGSPPAAGSGVDDFDSDESTAKVIGSLKRVFKLLLDGTAASAKELGKAEFDLLGQVTGLEDAKKLRNDLLSAAGCAPYSGLSSRNFTRAFVSSHLPVPGSSSVPSAVWEAVSATEMGKLLMDDKKRELLETELDRWAKALTKHCEGEGDYNDDDDENSFDEDDDDEDYEPWDLAEHHASKPASDMATRYELLGRKQGEEDLGEGRAGVVRKCVERQELPKEEEQQGEEAEQQLPLVRACKCISKKQQSEEETDRELAIMRKLIGVPGVCQLLDLYEAPDRLFLVTELCEGGELYNHVIERAEAEDGTPFSEPDAALIMKQVLTSVAMLHDEHQVVHRDIKPENLLLGTTNDYGSLTLIDFGLSRFFEPGQRLMTRVGTVYYTAPEVWAERYDHKCDVFSCGVLLYVLLCLYTPFDGDDDNDILRKVMRGKFVFPDEEWSSISDEAKDFVKKLMSKYPRRRPSAAEALAHPWFVHALGDQAPAPALAAAAAAAAASAAADAGDSEATTEGTVNPLAQAAGTEEELTLPPAAPIMQRQYT